MTKPMLLPPDNSYPYREIIDAQTGVTLATSAAPAPQLGTVTSTERQPQDPRPFRIAGALAPTSPKIPR
jgi:hypothetical protein